MTELLRHCESCGGGWPVGYYGWFRTRCNLCRAVGKDLAAYFNRAYWALAEEVADGSEPKRRSPPFSNSEAA